MNPRRLTRLAALLTISCSAGTALGSDWGPPDWQTRDVYIIEPDSAKPVTIRIDFSKGRPTRAMVQVGDGDAVRAEARVDPQSRRVDLTAGAGTDRPVRMSIDADGNARARTVAGGAGAPAKFFVRYTLYERKTDTVDCTAVVPELRTGSKEMIRAVDAFARETRRRIDKTHDEYIAGVKEVRREFADRLPATLGREHHEHWTLSLPHPRLLCLAANVNWYGGGAHANSHHMTRVLVQTDGRVAPLELAELFKKPDAGVARLSAIVVADLKRQEASDIVNGRITSLTAKDMRKFTIGPKGITVRFDTYAIGSGIEGPFTVTVPLSDLADALRADGPVASLIRSRP